MNTGISVITPCFNAGPFLRTCLESVLEQGSIVRRHIVMDGGSTDGSVDILREFSSRTEKLLWISEKDGGQSDALNKALALVDTQYFGWLNADDCYLPGGLEALGTELLRARTPPAIVYGDYKLIDADGNILKLRRQPSYNYWDCLYSYLTVQNCAALFNTDATKESGGVDREYHFCMDYELILRLARRGQVRHVRYYAGCFRHHAAAKTSQIPEICAAETQQLRKNVSRATDRQLAFRHAIGKMRVATRMLVEGCLPSRLHRAK